MTIKDYERAYELAMAGNINQAIDVSGIESGWLDNMSSEDKLNAILNYCEQCIIDLEGQPEEMNTAQYINYKY